MNERSKGIHHITVLSGDPAENLEFYTGVMGMRLIKQTVNYDDPGTWHLYFGDRTGTPGTLLTFFPLGPGIPRGTPGYGSVNAIAFTVPAGSRQYWTERLAEHGVIAGQPVDRFGESVLEFRDPDGLLLELVFSGKASPEYVWSEGTVPAEHAVSGFHGASLLMADSGPTAGVVTGVLNFSETDSSPERIRYSTGLVGPGSTLDLVTGAPAGIPRMGPGVVHHIAFRAADSAHQAAQADALRELGLRVTDVQDRNYFRSVYFREPGGVLFEIATDGPGFAVDEEVDALGSSLKLPARLEPYRERIAASLPALHAGAAGQAGSGR